jgi:hypothetical protein
VHYGPIWAGDWRRVLFTNLKATDALTPGHLEPQAVLLAVTGPGARPTWDEQGEVTCEGLPWDERHCAHRGPHKHAGPDGCRVDPWKGAEWNRTADARWSKLHRRAATETRRRFGNDALVLLTRAIEVQHRGVKHFHPVLLCTTMRHRFGVEFYAKRLSELAGQYGFGYVERKIKPQPASAAAAYLSAYFVKGKKEKAQLQHSVQHPAMRGSRILWMTPRLTQTTGATMREMRFRRFVWARYGHLIAQGGGWVDVARVLAETERELGRPLTGEELSSAMLGAAQYLSREEHDAATAA